MKRYHEEGLAQGHGHPYDAHHIQPTVMMAQPMMTQPGYVAQPMMVQSGYAPHPMMAQPGAQPMMAQPGYTA